MHETLHRSTRTLQALSLVLPSPLRNTWCSQIIMRLPCLGGNLMSRDVEIVRENWVGKAATHKAVGPGQAFTAEEVENASEFFKRLRIRLHDFLVENPQDPDAEVIYALAVKIAAAFPLNAKDGEVLEDPLTMEALTSDTPVFISSSGYIFDLEGAKTALDEIKKTGYLGLIGKLLPEI